jgi:hypothetical protein
MVVEEPLPVRVRGKVGGVNRDVLAHLGELRPEGSGERVKTSREGASLGV